jgi:hypothetical protein
MLLGTPLTIYVRRRAAAKKSTPVLPRPPAGADSEGEGDGVGFAAPSHAAVDQYSDIEAEVVGARRRRDAVRLFRTRLSFPSVASLMRLFASPHIADGVAAAVSFA